MTQEVPKLGELFTDDRPLRDAVHVAVEAVTALGDFVPGERVGISDAGRDKDGFYQATTNALPVGIVDPYLEKGVKRGERFLLCLFPNTVISMRHVWVHPAFTALHREAVRQAAQEARKEIADGG